MLSQQDTAQELYQSYEGVEQKDIQKLIQSYLVHHCYEETALEFGKHCKLFEQDEMDIDNNSMEMLQERKQVCRLVLDGKIAEALELIQESFPNLLYQKDQESMKVTFDLKCQQFIENVTVDAGEALEFAQRELGSFSSIPSATETLEDIISLIAYPTPQSSPLKHYLSQERRETVASNLNNYIISRNGGNTWTSLERLVQQATLVRDKLNTEKDVKNKVIIKLIEITYPKWSLPVFLA